MVKHTQTIRRQIADELYEMFDHFVGLALKGLTSVICWMASVYLANQKKKLMISTKM